MNQHAIFPIMRATQMPGNTRDSANGRTGD
jgi:hypothetical protein